MHRGDVITRAAARSKLIGRRRRLLDYVRDNDVDRYRGLVAETSASVDS